MEVRGTTSTNNVPLITKEVLAKGFLRTAVEYMDNDIGAVLDELVVIYARQKAIAEVNAIVADGDRPDEKQFEAMVEQNIWGIRHVLTNYDRYSSARLELTEPEPELELEPNSELPEPKNDDGEELEEAA